MKKILFLTLLTLSFTYNLRFTEESQSTIFKNWFDYLLKYYNKQLIKDLSKLLNVKEFIDKHYSPVLNFYNLRIDLFSVLRLFINSFKLYKEDAQIIKEITKELERIEKDSWYSLVIIYNPNNSLEQTKNNILKGIVLFAHKDKSGKSNYFVVEFSEEIKFFPNVFAYVSEKYINDSGTVVIKKFKKGIPSKPKNVQDSDIHNIILLYYILGVKSLCRKFNVNPSLPDFK